MAIVITPTHPVRAILFDLDGTLLDTAQDLVLALNTMLTTHGRATIPYETARFSVSQGLSLIHI